MAPPFVYDGPILEVSFIGALLYLIKFRLASVRREVGSSSHYNGSQFRKLRGE